jgi:hypothetical protein
MFDLGAGPGSREATPFGGAREGCGEAGGIRREHGGWAALLVRLPNTRVQRTRSSASPPHSPLTRNPLGGGRRLRWRMFRVLLLVACIGFLEAQPAIACSCVEYLNDPIEALAKSSLVFAGEVVSVEVISLPRITYFNNEPEPHQFMERKALVTLRTIKEWKGAGSTKYVVLAGAPPVTPLARGEVIVDCEEHLELGQKYLIFVEQYGYAEVNPCAPTSELQWASKAVATLDRSSAAKRSGPPGHRQ